MPAVPATAAKRGDRERKRKRTRSWRRRSAVSKRPPLGALVENYPDARENCLAARERRSRPTAWTRVMPPRRRRTVSNRRNSPGWNWYTRIISTTFKTFRDFFFFFSSSSLSLSSRCNLARSIRVREHATGRLSALARGDLRRRQPSSRLLECNCKMLAYDTIRIFAATFESWKLKVSSIELENYRYKTRRCLLYYMVT